MAALLANINMFSLLFWSHPTMSKTPLLGKNGWGSLSEYIGTYEPGQSAASGGFAWYTSMVNGVGDWLIPILNQQGDIYGHTLWEIAGHVFFYVAIMTVGSMYSQSFGLILPTWEVKTFLKIELLENSGSERIRSYSRRSSSDTFHR